MVEVWVVGVGVCGCVAGLDSEAAGCLVVDCRCCVAVGHSWQGMVGVGWGVAASLGAIRL